MAPAPAPGPPPAKPAEVLTDLRRSTLGRRPTDEEVRKAVEAVAMREGTTDLATLQNKIGVSSTQIQGPLQNLMQSAKFRAAVEAAKPVAGAADEAAAAVGAKARDARAAAQSPVDNVSGRQAKQVAAVGQQEKWRATYDSLPAENRQAFLDQLRAESGLPDDVIRKRLGLTLAEWRRTSFTRSTGTPVLRKKTKPAP